MTIITPYRISVADAVLADLKARRHNTSHLERKFVTLVDGSNLCRGERLWGMQV